MIPATRKIRIAEGTRLASEHAMQMLNWVTSTHDRTSLLIVFLAACLASNLSAAAPVLSNATASQSELRFVLNGESNVTYTIEASTDLLTWTAAATSKDVSPQRLVTLPATNSARYCRARVAKPLFTAALAARGEIDLLGNNIRIDSFDSTDPVYSTGGQYDVLKAKDNGDIAAYLPIANVINLGNADIYGRIFMSPGGSASLGPLGSVGDFEWHAAGINGVQPGFLVTNLSWDFPEVRVAFTGGFPSLPTGTNGFDYELPSGNYQLTSLDLNNKSMLAEGNVSLYITGDFSVAGSGGIFLAVAATLKLYVGGSAYIGGNGIINNGKANDLTYYGLPSSTNLTYGANGTLVGCIYAPNADFILNGAGNNVYDFVGASVTKTVAVRGHFNFHFDESLKRIGPLF
jgi:hypothetical protein